MQQMTAPTYTVDHFLDSVFHDCKNGIAGQPDILKIQIIVIRL